MPLRRHPLGWLDDQPQATAILVRARRSLPARLALNRFSAVTLRVTLSMSLSILKTRVCRGVHPCASEVKKPP